MFLDRDRKVWLACSEGDWRPALQCVKIERTEPYHSPIDAHTEFNGRAIAVNGYIMAVVPVELDEGEEDCLIPRDVFLQAAKVRGVDKEYDHLFLGLGKADERIVLANGWTAPKYTPVAPAKPFPDWRAIVPRRADVLGLVDPLRAFNPALLQTLRVAIGAVEGVLLTLPTERSSALLVETRAGSGVGVPVPPFGVLMPMHAGQGVKP